jgi:hypothetical protein
VVEAVHVPDGPAVATVDVLGDLDAEHPPPLEGPLGHDDEPGSVGEARDQPQQVVLVLRQHPVVVAGAGHAAGVDGHLPVRGPGSPGVTREDVGDGHLVAHAGGLQPGEVTGPQQDLHGTVVEHVVGVVERREQRALLRAAPPHAGETQDVVGTDGPGPRSGAEGPEGAAGRAGTERTESEAGETGTLQQ